MLPVQRMKERGGGGSRVTALKPQKVDASHGWGDGTGVSWGKTMGNGNRRSVSRGKVPPPSQKPPMPPIPVQKSRTAPSTKDNKLHGRSSSLSLLKGKTSLSSNGSCVQFKHSVNPKIEDLGKCNTLSNTRNLAKCQHWNENLSSNSRVSRENHRKYPSPAFNHRGKGSEIADKCINKIYVDTNLRDMENGVTVSSADTGMFLASLDRKENSTAIMDNINVGEHQELGADSCSAGKSMNADSEVRNKNDLNVLKNDQTPASESSSCGFLAGEARPISSNCRARLPGPVNDDQSVNRCRTASDVGKPSNLTEAEGKDSDFEGSLENVIVRAHSNLMENNIGSSENCKEANFNGANRALDVQVHNKSPNKLHERLAFLEAKVNKIALEIKRTKELLEANNPRSSKQILADIKDKILGIEKAVVNVIDDGECKISIPEDANSGILPSISESESRNESSGMLNCSIIGLNAEEIEARFFPHHKLLRDRTRVDSVMEHVRNSHFSQMSISAGAEDCFSMHEDENPIASEFLATLEKSHCVIGTGGGQAITGSSKVQIMESNSQTSGTQDVLTRLVTAQKRESTGFTTDEHIDDSDDQENTSFTVFQGAAEDASLNQLQEIGCKSSTGGWFVSEGESVLLAHGDNTCSFFDLTHSEVKAEYKAPSGQSHNLWGDCWVIRAPGPDGCSGRYVVAASAGNTMYAGFCSWDFYTKDIQAFHVDDRPGPSDSFSRISLGVPGQGVCGRSSVDTAFMPQDKQGWCKPCGPLLISTTSCWRSVRIYDIRDGDLVMKWEAPKPVQSMDYSSPLQWRSRGKVLIAEADSVAVWDVNSLRPQLLQSVPFNKRITALHVNNTDAELGGGVRQRISSSEIEGNDGVFCTNDTINVLDLRLQSGVALKMQGLSKCHSVFSRGDSIFVGGNGICATREQESSWIQQFSLRKAKLLATYALPESNLHSYYSSLAQVWGDSQFVMGICGAGLFIFETSKGDGSLGFSTSHGSTRHVREIVGPDDLYSPSFDYLSSRILVISRDRPALWRYLS